MFASFDQINEEEGKVKEHIVSRESEGGFTRYIVIGFGSDREGDMARN